MGRRRSNVQYDPRIAEYIEDGVIVPKERVTRIMADVIEDTFERMANQAQSVFDGLGSLRTLRDAGVTELRLLHNAMAYLGKGGAHRMTIADKRRLRRTFKEELRFFNGFMRDIEAGKVVSRAQFEARLHLYADKAWFQFWESHTESKRQAGFTEERRFLEPTAQHCDDCVALARQGWQPLGTLPNPADGNTECGSRDRCRKEYR